MHVQEKYGTDVATRKQDFLELGTEYEIVLTDSDEQTNKRNFTIYRNITNQ